MQNNESREEIKNNISKYNPQEIEKKWQEYWKENETYKIDTREDKKKFYILDMFPYPSGEGLHVGHPKGYIATDIYSRLMRAKGYNVLHPMGWDAFGLPAEQYALKMKVNPNISTAKNVSRYKEQLEMLGLNYDWSKEINTTDPKFYKWTQWMWKEMYKKGLVVESYDPINWCPSCMTGLANEDLDGNVCERCGSLVEKKPIRQWTIKITEYADRLLEDIDKLNWETHIKELQRNWIGRSEGSEIDFKILNSEENKIKDNLLKVFTTRADTLFGCTFMSINHNVAKEWIENGWEAAEEIKNFIKELEEEEKVRTIDFDINKLEKKGIDTGIKAINPANQKEVPIYIANYILSDYGTGAVMAVPAHDERDRDFALKYNIEILNIEVTDTDEERKTITGAVGGKLVKKYRLKDWTFARQRYWGEPFPVVFATNENGEADYSKSYLVADSELPVLLPNVESYEPTGTGESPLANIKEFTDVYGYINEEGEFESVRDEKNNFVKSLGEAKEIASKRNIQKEIKFFRRETNTMPQWAGSSWYYLRYIDPQNENAFCDKDLEKNWSPVDFYVGGAEHATRHLIYARFWHKVMFDLGYVSYDEPFTKLQTVGLIQAEDGRKMSKRWGNVINPDDIVKEFGADSLRVYEMFMGPFDGAVAWSTSSIKGVRRFLDRVWNLQEKINENSNNDFIINKTLKKVEADVMDFKFNTAISQMMIALNEVEKNGIKKEDYKKFILTLSIFAPHMCEELWKGYFAESDSIVKALMPEIDESKLIEDSITIAVQIGGKLRGTFEAKVDLSDEEIENLFKNTDIYKKYILDADAEVKKIIVVQNKIVNVVI